MISFPGKKKSPEIFDLNSWVDNCCLALLSKLQYFTNWKMNDF